MWSRLSLAAEKVLARFERRFGHRDGLDITAIKDRWFRRQSWEVVRDRFGCWVLKEA